MARTLIADNFEKVRELRKDGWSVGEISNELGLKKGTVGWIVSAIMQGYDSVFELSKSFLKKRINPETGEPFSDLNEYNKFITRRNGFRRCSDYYTMRRALRKDYDGPSESGQVILERSINLYPPEKFLTMPSNEVDPYERVVAKDQRDYLEALLDSIPERLRKILKMRYFEEKSLKIIGKDLGISRERVRQLEERALGVLRNGENEKKVVNYEDGERLLAYILSKSVEDWEDNLTKKGRIARFINENYHEREVRTSGSVDYAYKNGSEEKFQKLREKYFPSSLPKVKPSKN